MGWVRDSSQSSRGCALPEGQGPNPKLLASYKRASAVLTIYASNQSERTLPQGFTLAQTCQLLDEVWSDEGQDTLATARSGFSEKVGQNLSNFSDEPAQDAKLRSGSCVGRHVDRSRPYAKSSASGVEARLLLPVHPLSIPRKCFL